VRSQQIDHPFFGEILPAADFRFFTFGFLSLRSQSSLWKFTSCQAMVIWRAQHATSSYLMSLEFHPASDVALYLSLQNQIPCKFKYTWLEPSHLPNCMRNHAFVSQTWPRGIPCTSSSTRSVRKFVSSSWIQGWNTNKSPANLSTQAWVMTPTQNSTRSHTNRETQKTRAMISRSQGSRSPYRRISGTHSFTYEVRFRSRYYGSMQYVYNSIDPIRNTAEFWGRPSG
jgi:hypothetical protein